MNFLLNAVKILKEQKEQSKNKLYFNDYSFSDKLDSLYKTQPNSPAAPMTIDASKISFTEKLPTVNTSADGVLTLVGIDNTTMDVIVKGGKYDSSTHKISGLKSEDVVEVSLTPKGSTTNPVVIKHAIGAQSKTGFKKPNINLKINKDNLPRTSISADGIVDVLGINVNTMDVKIKESKTATNFSNTIHFFGGIDISPKIKGLTSGRQIFVFVSLKDPNEFWEDGTNTPIEKSVTMYDQTSIGVDKPQVTFSSTLPKTSASKDGVLTLAGIDNTTMDITVDNGIYNSLSYEISGVKSKQEVEVSITTKSGYVWTKKETPKVIKMKIKMGEQYKKAIQRPKITWYVSTIPSLKNSNDGVIKFTKYDPNIKETLREFDNSIMDISVSAGKVNYNKTSGQIEISDLQVGEQTKVLITPKVGQSWEDGTIKPFEVKPIPTMDKRNRADVLLELYFVDEEQFFVKEKDFVLLNSDKNIEFKNFKNNFSDLIQKIKKGENESLDKNLTEAKEHLDNAIKLNSSKDFVSKSKSNILFILGGVGFIAFAILFSTGLFFFLKKRTK